VSRDGLSDVAREVGLESPIEERMLAALALHCEDREMRISLRKRLPTCWPVLEVHPQYQLDDLRLDFLVLLRCNSDAVMMVVECDGHEFHERTKEQAERDRCRDREIQSLDVPIFRFTGTEIHRDGDACAREIVEELVRRLDRECPWPGPR